MCKRPRPGSYSPLSTTDGSLRCPRPRPRFLQRSRADELPRARAPPALRPHPREAPWRVRPASKSQTRGPSPEFLSRSATRTSLRPSAQRRPTPAARHEGTPPAAPRALSLARGPHSDEPFSHRTMRWLLPVLPARTRTSPTTRIPRRTSPRRGPRAPHHPEDPHQQHGPRRAQRPRWTARRSDRLIPSHEAERMPVSSSTTSPRAVSFRTWYATSCREMPSRRAMSSRVNGPAFRISCRIIASVERTST